MTPPETAAPQTVDPYARAGSPYETLRYGLRDDVATLALARPERLNALDAQAKADLAHALRRAAAEARAVVLTGLGEAFCAGHALGDAPRIRELDLGRTQREETRPLLEAMAACPLPILAAVNGIAAGAGLALALAADIAIAAEGASFAVTSSRVGTIPDAGLSFWLPRLVGPARARGLALLGEPISARQAAEWGLIWEAVPDAAFAERVDARARALAAGPTEGYRLTREALRSGLELPWAEQLEREADLQAQAGRTRDFLVGALAEAEGAAPAFKGR
ncbi:enoyl-CoA hydratase-related protein [Albimonas sp. CAU 1670]|uniref:enoyl-CoA hydratase-related protein n=1 Tax=Albimonas sp. CAU 1670 TaxID=3032599 RepID=UPI0023DA85B2|nr:enoyl-CoA hydratase-related protein [Albimonas sp. CAU 1670]MDF2232127.1 enoyl-CoA hydratase-related protein [Albimonas sp. CAU 1670]